MPSRRPPHHARPPRHTRLAHDADQTGPAHRPGPAHRSSPAYWSSLAHSQNFLTSRPLVARLVNRSTIQAEDVVVEIGPGRGIITEALARRSRQVIAVEKDPRLARLLRGRFADAPNVVVREADFLGVALPPTPYKVFANIPFNQTTPIVTKLTAGPNAPEDSYLVVQREAADRFSGEPRETLVALLLKPWFAPSVVHRFQRHDFSPAPGVDVVLLRLQKRGPPLVSPADTRLYRDFVTASFTAWHRSVADALASLVGRRTAGQIVQAVGIPPEAPPSRVRFAHWLMLFHAVKASGRLGRVYQRLAGAERQFRQQQRRLTRTHRTRGARTRRPPPARQNA